MIKEYRNNSKNHLNMALKIDEYVLKEACYYTRKLQDEGFSNLKVSVNIFALHFQNNKLLLTIHNILNETGLLIS